MLCSIGGPGYKKEACLTYVLYLLRRPALVRYPHLPGKYLHAVS